MSDTSFSPPAIRSQYASSRAALAFVAVGILQLGLSQAAWRLRQAQEAIGAPEAEAAKQSPALYRVLSFGHLPAAVDWLWIKALGETDVRSAAGTGKRTPFYRDVDLLTDLDPLFTEIYLIGGNVLAILQNEGLAARDLVLKGERFRKTEFQAQPASYRQRYWPDQWRLPLLLAYVQLFELNDMPSAAESFKEAAGLPSAPAYLLRLQKRLEQPGGEYEVGLKLIDFMIAVAKERDMKESLARKRADLQVAAYLHELDRARAAAGKRPPPLPGSDPWGGKLSLDGSGKVVTTTPHERVFGLE